MLRTRCMLAAGALCFLAGSANAQATFTPSFNAPRAPFVRSEFGGVMSFPDGGTAYEGAYRVGSRRLDIGIRGGLLDPVGPVGSWALMGVEGRAQIITHDPYFPVDGALIFGAGGRIRSGQSLYSIPLGISLGRQLNVERSTVSLTPYVQPTAVVLGGNTRSTDVVFAMGLGANLRLGGTFDTRLSIGIGDLHGISLGAVWVH
ncbi:MAG TPA: hypothetical protein VD793_08755 [Gemmatimonadales bacterium]|nr:hypothetical protein [Gemmatimonadales bacterium]